VFSFAKKDDQSPAEMAGLKTPMKSTRLIKVLFSLVKLFSPNPKQSAVQPLQIQLVGQLVGLDQRSKRGLKQAALCC